MYRLKPLTGLEQYILCYWFLMQHPNLQRLQLIMLGTKDANSQYEKYGFRI
jgi:hypothetical protein